jgi:hypothetical protein
MNAPDRPLRLTEFSHGGGCGCKIAPGVLQQIIGQAAPGILPEALLVGIDKYDNSPAAKVSMRSLAGAVKDADAMAALLKDKFGFEVRVLRDQEATRDGILSAIKSYLVEGAASGDDGLRRGDLHALPLFEFSTRLLGRKECVIDRTAIRV